MIIKANDNETFKNAVTEMMAYRNRRTRRSEKKIKITCEENDEQIIVENLQIRFRCGFGRCRERFGRLQFEEEVWSYKIIYNKNTNIIGFENPIINDEDKDGIIYYDLEKTAVTFLSF